MVRQQNHFGCFWFIIDLPSGKALPMWLLGLEYQNCGAKEEQ